MQEMDERLKDKMQSKTTRTFTEILENIGSSIKKRSAEQKSKQVVTEEKESKGLKRVCKSNALARAIYKYTLAEKRIMELAISKVQSYKSDLSSIEISAREYADACEISIDDAYRDLDASVKGLMSKFLTIESGESVKHITLMSHAEYSKNQGKVVLAFNDRLKPHINALQSNFTAYPIQTPCSFKTFYTWRFYELIMSWLKFNRKRKDGGKKEKNAKAAEGFMILSVNDLRVVLSVPESYNYAMFSKRVLQKSLEEITLKTDITVNVEYKKQGKKIDQLKINFSILNK